MPLPRRTSKNPPPTTPAPQAKKAQGKKATAKKAAAKEAPAKQALAKQATTKAAKPAKAAPPSKSAGTAKTSAAPKTSRGTSDKGTVEKKPAAATRPKFAGFPSDAVAFLADLEAHNEREWFERNRPRYEAAVRAPAMALIEAMGALLPEISKHFVADPRPVGGSLMRIHRDVRFSSDKRPYKTNIGIQFRHAAGKDVHAPGIYLHVEPARTFLGAGVWHPEPDLLALIRRRIATKPREWASSIADPVLRKQWKLEGESLARPPKGFDAEHEHIADLKRKDFIAVTSLEHAHLHRSDLPQQLIKRLAPVKPLLAFLCAAAGQPF